ncbi:MAG: prenyltransferase [Gammaproteobacteria bacterium]
MKSSAVIQSMRGPFLVLTPVCVLLGASTVVANQARVDLQLLLLALLGAVLAHISVNTLNEYLDFKSGLDLNTTRTRFSGGSGALPRDPGRADAVFTTGVISLLGTLLIGFFFVWKHGWGILPIGAAGLVLILSYTGWINKHPFLCLVAPGTGFGILMVVGTQYVLQGDYATLSWLVAVVPFLLVNNLLLLNQYPDIKADAGAGRRHLPIACGTTVSSRVYALFAVATILAIAGYILLGWLPAASLVALLPMPLAFFALYGAAKHGETLGKFPRYLGANTAVAILTPLLLGVSLVI